MFPVCHYGSLVLMKSLGFQSETLYSTHLKVLSPTVLLVAADRHSKHDIQIMKFRCCVFSPLLKFNVIAVEATAICERKVGPEGEET